MPFHYHNSVLMTSTDSIRSLRVGKKLRKYLKNCKFPTRNDNSMYNSNGCLIGSVPNRTSPWSNLSSSLIATSVTLDSTKSFTHTPIPIVLETYFTSMNLVNPILLKVCWVVNLVFAKCTTNSVDSLLVRIFVLTTIQAF